MFERRVFAIAVRSCLPVFRLISLLVLAALLTLTSGGCARGNTASRLGDKAAAERAAAAESRKEEPQQAGQSRGQGPAALLSGSDLGVAYQFILESFVDQVDHAALIEAAAGSTRQQLAEAGALPVDTAPLDLLPLPTTNPARDWSDFGAAFDGLIQRHPAWSQRARPDYGALRNMLESLDDNHSSFLTADESRRRAETTYSGIGIRIARPDRAGPPVVVEVFAASPASLSGVLVGDRIVGIGEQQTAQLRLSEVADLVRGPQGSEVVLQIERTAARGPVMVRAVRRRIDSPLADGQILEPGVGYIRIRSFGQTTAERVGALLVEQRQAGAQGWLIDLRGNPGGDLEIVRRVAGYFLVNRVIGISVDRTGQREGIMSEPRQLSVRAPLVVLIDGDSGSGSEILAAALQEYQLATLVGQKSAGSVGIANGRQLSDGSVVQLTVRRLLSASGAQLDRVGVQPDEIMPLTAEDLEAGRDPQRDRAVQLLRERFELPPSPILIRVNRVRRYSDVGIYSRAARGFRREGRL